MKFLIRILVILFFLVFSCKEELEKEKIIFSDPVKFNMKFIPVNPGTKDEIKLIVYEDCSYNILASLIKDGSNINIIKKFNSMMKMACMIRNDTIVIGKLTKGTYAVNYKLIDIANLVKDNTPIDATFLLQVSE